MILLCGSDVFTGSEIWKYYRELEVDEHEDLVDMQASSAELQKSKERFIKVYHRQLSLPLVGNEETLKEFEQKLGELCVASDVGLINPADLEKKVSAAREMREGRLMYEMHLLSDKHESSAPNEKETFWKGYIAYERKQAQLSRTQRLFERAVLDCPSSLSLWLDFTDFALTVLKNWTLLASVTKRALKVFRSSVFLYKLRLISLEGANETIEAVQETFQQALNAGLSNVEEYLDIYLCLCDYLRRRVEKVYQKLQQQKQPHADLVEIANEAVEALQGGLNQTQAFLTSFGTTWVAGWWRLCKYQAQIESTLLSPMQDILTQLEVVDQVGPVTSFGSKVNIPKKTKPTSKLLPGTEIWEVATKLFPTSYFMWSEYVQWTKQAKEFEHCRKLYRKMINLNLDVTSSEICKEWVNFEQRHGTLQDIQVAMSKAFAHTQVDLLQLYTPMTEANSSTNENSVMEVQEEVTYDKTSHNQNSNDKKRKSNILHDDTEHTTHSPHVTAPSTQNPHTSPSAKKVKFTEMEQNHTSSQVGLTPSASVSTTEIVPPAPTLPVPELSPDTVVVSNFPFHATIESIRPMIFDKCDNLSTEDLEESNIITLGKVVEVRLLLSKAGHSRGAVEVEFAPAVTQTGSNGEELDLRPYMKAVVSILHGYVYNERSLKAEIKSIAPPGGGEGHNKKVKVDPLVLQQRAGSVTAPHLTTVFVSHLSPEVTTEQLKVHFQSCGEVLAAKVAVEKKTGASKVSK
jgi:RNA recognition motif-containing protein